jgi:RimJ/RimL family protein N-acetyltransferase
MEKTTDPGSAGSFELDFVDCECPHCHATLSFVRPQAGTVQQCPQCSESLIVPAHGEAVGQRLPIPVATPRLRLRGLRDGDEEEIVELMSEEHSSPYLNWLPRGEDDIKEWLEKEKLIRLGQSGRPLSLGVELADPGRLIGIVSLYFTDGENRQAALAWMIGKAFLPEYGAEAVRGALGFCLQGLRLHRVVANNDSRNEAVIGLLEKAGMRCEAEFVKDQFVHGEWGNTVWRAMLGEEFKP